jgi:hypothetical protein
MYDRRIEGGVHKNLIGYLLLVLVIASGASFVPLGVSLAVDNPMMKVSWRVTNMLPFLFIVGFWQAYT